VAGGVRGRLLSCYRAAAPLRKPYVKRKSTDSARSSRAKTRKEQFQKPTANLAILRAIPPYFWLE
jgi:hypothetical protein